MSTFTQDLRYSLRTYLKTPGSTAVAIIVLSLGIGASAAIFSVSSTILFRSLPYKDPGRLVGVWENNPSKAIKQWRLAPADYAEFRAQSQVFDGIGAFRTQSAVLAGGEVPERIEIAAVSPSVLTILGMRAAVGRSFDPDEDQPDKNQVAILSAGLWQRRFGGDPNIVGKKLSLDGGSFSIIGVAGPQFRLPDGKSELWIPYTPNPKDFLPQNRGVHFLTTIARLKPDVSIETAQTEMRIIADRLAREYPDSNAGFSVFLLPLRDQMIGNIRPTLWMLIGAVAVLLLIACANVAHLLLARAGSREKEIAVRTALGANPARLVQQLLTESVSLALIAGLLGLLIAYWGTWFLAKIAPTGLPGAEQTQLDWRVLAFTLAVSVITGLAFGLAPALSSARSNLNLVLRSGGRGGTGGRTRSLVRDVLMVCEVASSAALLIAAGLLIRSLVRLQEVNPGFRIDHVLTMRLSLPPSRYSGQNVGLFYRQLLSRVEGLPGVQMAGVCRYLPLTGADIKNNFLIEGQPQVRTADQPLAYFRSASTGYFAALGIPLLEGRLFDQRDDEHTPKTVIINQAAVRRYWPNENPIGKRILSGLDQDKWSTIIGVVGDVKHAGLDTETEPETYYHYLQIPPQSMNLAEGTVALVIRTTVDPATMTSAVREAVRMLDPGLPIFDVATMESVVSESMNQPRFRTFLVTIFAGLALILASLGLYGVISYSVTQRTTEMGIRLALGADSSSILKLVVGHAAGLAGIGLGVGIALAFAGSQLMSRFLFGIHATDPITLGATSLVILLVAFAASLLPALRAIRVDPTTALRAE